MGNENLDLSWIASQESVDELKALTLNCMDQVDALRRVLDPFYGFEIGTYNNLLEWDHTFDESNKIVTLTCYQGEKEHVIMYDAYKNDSGIIYHTKFTRQQSSTTTTKPLLNNVGKSKIKSFRFCNNVIMNVNSFSDMFRDTPNLTSVDFGLAFKECQIINTNGMFRESGIESVDFTNVGFSNCYADFMFYNAYNLTDVDFGPQIIELESTAGMFSSNSESGPVYPDNGNKSMQLRNIRLNIRFTGTNSTRSSMNSMFHRCTYLQHIDVSNWDTSNITRMIGVFRYCTSLTELNLTNWDTSNVTAMNGMFEGCSSITEFDLTSFNTSKVTTVAEMFKNCTNLQVVKIGSKWSTTGADKTRWFEGAGCTGVTRV